MATLLPTKSPAFETSPLLLGGRAPAPAPRELSAVLSINRKIRSRFALNAGETRS